MLFFGSRDYAWLNAFRAFKYADGDTGGSKQKSYLEKYFVKGLILKVMTFLAGYHVARSHKTTPVSWLVSWLVIFLKNRSKDFLDFRHGSSDP